MQSKLWTALKILISLALVIWVFSKVHLAEVGAELAGANLWFIVLALALYLAAITINAVKWQVLLRAQRVVVPFRAVLEFQFVGFFFNNILPNIGGDVMRGYGLARHTDRNADAAVSVIVDRIIGLMAYMATAVVAAIISVNLSGHAGLKSVEMWAVLALAVLALGFGLLLSRRLRSLISRILSWGFLKRLLPIWERLSEAFNSYRFRYGALALAFGVGLLGIIATTLVNWSLSQAMGGAMHLVDILLFNPLIGLVLIIPISVGGGIGVNQNLYPFFYGLVGVPGRHALAVSLVMQLVIVLGSLPGGVFWLSSRRRAAGEAAAGPAADPA